MADTMTDQQRRLDACGHAFWPFRCERDPGHDGPHQDGTAKWKGGQE